MALKLLAIFLLLSPPPATAQVRDKARRSFQHAAEQWSLEDAVWSWKASQQLPNFDRVSAKQRLESLLDRTKSNGNTSSRSGWWPYNVAMLDRALDNTQQSEKELREALLSPDELLTYHLTRLAVSSRNP